MSQLLIETLNSVHIASSTQICGFFFMKENFIKLTSQAFRV